MLYSCCSWLLYSRRLLYPRRTVRQWLTLSPRALSLEQWVEQVDVFSLEFTQKYGPRYGIWLPASKVWIPWLHDNW